MAGLLTFLAFAVSAWVTRSLSHPSSSLCILDHPNERSLHSAPLPRTGGLAICTAVVLGGGAAALVIGTDPPLTWLASGTLLVAGVSFVDDLYTLNVGSRILAHLAAAVLFVGYGGFFLSGLEVADWRWSWPESAGAVISLLFGVWMINLYNFMDGMDGLASGMAVIGFGTFAIFGWQAGSELFAVLNLITCGAAGGFLLFNFPPAKIFMGDVGSSALGFLAAAFSLWGNREGIFPFWIAVLVFSPFIIDATVTLLHRLWHGEKVWQAHKTHYYQRLVQLGWGQRKTVLYEYGLMLLCAGSALAVKDTPGKMQWLAMGAWALVYMAMMVSIGIAEGRVRKTS